MSLKTTISALAMLALVIHSRSRRAALEDS